MGEFLFSGGRVKDVYFLFMYGCFFFFFSDICLGGGGMGDWEMY